MNWGTFLVTFGVFCNIGVGTAHEPGVATLQYRRIHVAGATEFPLIYQLLESYITSPKLALTVKEIVFRPQKLSDCCHLYKKPSKEQWIAKEADRDVSGEDIIRRGVQRLDLSPENEERWVRALTWMKPELVEQRNASIKRADVEYHFQKFVTKQNIQFAYHATALLLMLCPNIERLTYRDNELQNPLKHILRRNNYGLLPNQHLQNLKKVSLLGTDDDLFGDDRFYASMDVLNLLRMFHRLPNIESVSAEAIEVVSESEGIFPPGTTNMKRISITHSQFDSEAIAALIRAPKALEHLTITIGGRASEDGGSPSLFVVLIGKALQCHKASLVELDLDLGYASHMMYYQYPEDVWNPFAHEKPSEKRQDDEWQVLESREDMVDEMEAQGPLRTMRLPQDRFYGTAGQMIGSLHDFKSLKRLSVNIFYMHDANLSWKYKLIDALPPNLEYLLIRGYTKGEQQDLDEEIAEVLRLKSERFPKLEEIHGIDELVPEGKTIPFTNTDPELVWKPEHVDQGWLEHNHDEL